MSPERKAQAWKAALYLAILMWPVSQLTFLSSEPPGTLSLSWLAIIFELSTRSKLQKDSTP